MIQLVWLLWIYNLLIENNEEKIHLNINTNENSKKGKNSHKKLKKFENDLSNIKKKFKK